MSIPFRAHAIRAWRRAAVRRLPWRRARWAFLLALSVSAIPVAAYFSGYARRGWRRNFAADAFYAWIWWPGTTWAYRFFPWTSSPQTYFGVDSDDFYLFVAVPVFGTATLHAWLTAGAFLAFTLVRRFQTAAGRDRPPVR